MIIPYTKANKNGEKTTFWTHSSFIDDEKILEIRKEECARKTYRNYAGLLGAVIGLKLTTIPAVTNFIPKSIPTLTVAGVTALLSFGLGHAFLVNGFVDREINKGLEATTIPLWRSKNNVLSLYRAFFHLDETKNNQVNLLHHALTPESAAKIFPDAISGPPPKAPERHSHGQGHGHSHEHH